jgi:hypothetical protein
MKPQTLHLTGAWQDQQLFSLDDPELHVVQERERSWERYEFRLLCDALSLTRGLSRSDPRRKKAVDNAKKFLDSGGLDRI